MLNFDPAGTRELDLDTIQTQRLGKAPGKNEGIILRQRQITLRSNSTFLCQHAPCNLIVPSLV